MYNLTCPNVCAVQRPIEQSEGENFAEEIVLFFHQEVPQDHTDTHQELEKSTVHQVKAEKESKCEESMCSKMNGNRKPKMSPSLNIIIWKHMLHNNLNEYTVLSLKSLELWLRTDLSQEKI